MYVSWILVPCGGVQDMTRYRYRKPVDEDGTAIVLV